MKRPDKALYYLKIASIVLERGTCLRRNYGAVIVKDDQIVSTGYTGSPRRSRNCCDREICARTELSIPAGERYELCESVHAEMNAIIHAGRERCIGAAIYIIGKDMASRRYLSTLPCPLCSRVIKNAGIIWTIVPESEVLENEFNRK